MLKSLEFRYFWLNQMTYRINNKMYSKTNVYFLYCPIFYLNVEEQSFICFLYNLILLKLFYNASIKVLMNMILLFIIYSVL